MLEPSGLSEDGRTQSLKLSSNPRQRTFDRALRGVDPYTGTVSRGSEIAPFSERGPSCQCAQG